MARFAEERFRDDLVPTRSPGRAAVRSGLVGTALVLSVVCLAGPSWGFRWERIERRGIDVVVALDLSRSMLARDVDPDRLTAAKREIRDLVDLLQGDRVGLVVFAGTAFIQCPLTLDYNALQVFLDQLDPDWVPIGGTDLGAAIRTSIETFVQKERSGRAVILITDGEDHGGELQAAATEAKAQGVHVFVVGIGSPEGVPIPDGRGGFVKDGGSVVLSKLDEPALKELAMTTGGSYVRRVSGVADLREIYLDDIKQALESRELGSSRQRRAEERFQWFLLPAFLLLFAEPLLGPRRRAIGKRSQAPPLPATTLAAALAVAGTSSLVPSQASAGLFSPDPAREAISAFDGGDFQGALDRWLEAQAADPDDRALDYDIGMARYRLGRFDEAEKAFVAASASDDPELAADALYGAGNALFQQGRFLDAIAAYDRSLQVRPDDQDAVVNRDLAQRRYEEMLEKARDEQREKEKKQEDSEDASCDEPQQGQEGEDGQQQQQQQQGQGMSEQEQQQPQEGKGQEEDQQEKQAQPEGPDDGQAEQQQQEATGGKAQAADVDREAPEQAEAEPDGEVAEQTREDEPGAGAAAQAIEGALTEEQAEALLRALEADQANRRRERTEREAARGRRAAEKDW